MTFLKTNRTGQLLIPMLGLLFMFGLFLAGYVRWCQHEYWAIRMDVAARATALSAARTQAAMLNTVGTIQLMENLFVQKAQFGGVDYAGVQDAMAESFMAWNQLLQATYLLIGPRVMATAYKVAKENGANGRVIPLDNPIPDLHWKSLSVVYLLYLLPDGFDDYPRGYLTRGWESGVRKAQPPKKKALGWQVCRSNEDCEYAWAQLWLDVNPSNPLVNGGYPQESETILGGVGIQSLYPQFNARLLARRSPIES